MKNNIENMLKVAEKGSKTRNFETVENLINYVKKFQEKLVVLTGSKKSLAGTKAIISPFSGSFASAYKSIPMGSEVHVLFDSKGEPKIEKILRNNCNHVWVMRVEYSDSAKESMIKHNSTF